MNKKIVYIFLCLISLFVWIPIIIIVSSSFMGNVELVQNIGAVLNNIDGKTILPIFPKFPTLKSYVELFLDSPEFFIMFWNSCKQVFPGLFGQILVGTPAAWAIAEFEFKGKKILFSLYIILMLMPFWTLMVPSYIALDKLNILNTNYAIIFPIAFSTFPVFVMTKFFSGIPKSLIEAARIDGANEFHIFLKIGLPLGAPGIISAFILGFLENWNSIEQPLVFLKDKSKLPLSLYIPQITVQKAGISLAASVVMLALSILIFLYGQKYLQEGIQAGIKE